MTQLNIAIVAHGSDPQNPEYGHYAVAVDADTPEGVDAEWKFCAGEKTLAVCKVVLTDEGTERNAETFEALDALNRLSDDPRVTDLLMHLFAKGFENGMNYKAQQMREQSGVS